MVYERLSRDNAKQPLRRVVNGACIFVVGLLEFNSHRGTTVWCPFVYQGQPRRSEERREGLRYRCLLLDHDDTTVKGTEEVHYPAHVESIRVLRPDLEPCSLNEWFEKNHDPGVSMYLKSLFATKEMMDQEHAIWEKAIARSDGPSFYDGMVELLTEFRARGGVVAVVSHSPADAIWRHYEAHSEAKHIRPDLVLGWDPDPQKRKPSPWPAHEAMKRLGVRQEEVLVLDDLAPGVKMAKAVGVSVAGSGWGHAVPVIQEYMRQECDYYFTEVNDFKDFLFSSPPSSAL